MAWSLGSSYKSCTHRRLISCVGKPSAMRARISSARGVGSLLAGACIGFEHELINVIDSLGDFVEVLARRQVATFALARVGRRVDVRAESPVDFTCEPVDNAHAEEMPIGDRFSAQLRERMRGVSGQRVSVLAQILVCDWVNCKAHKSSLSSSSSSPSVTSMGLPQSMQQIAASQPSEPTSHTCVRAYSIAIAEL